MTKPIRYIVAEAANKVATADIEDSEGILKQRNEKENIVTLLHKDSSKYTEYKAYTHAAAAILFIGVAVTGAIVKDTNVAKSLPTALHAIGNNSTEAVKAFFDKYLAVVNPKAQMEDQKLSELRRMYNDIKENTNRTDQIARRIING